MRNKTYLTPAEQWDRTVGMYISENSDYYANSGSDYALATYLYLGQITRPHRLFLKGDIVIIEPSNGAGERQPVYAVSSKGYPVRRLYMNYRRYRWVYHQHPHRCTSRPKAPGALRPCRCCGSAHSSLNCPIAPPSHFFHIEADGLPNLDKSLAGEERTYSNRCPLSWLELPADLTGEKLDDPAVRAFVLGTLRAG